jgi:DNA mismatch endonuclease (patch repair protein)
MPKANQDYWVPKFARNVARDMSDTAGLEECGWTVLRFFEHVPPREAAVAVQDALAQIEVKITRSDSGVGA